MTESHYQDGIRLPMIYDVLPFGLWISIKDKLPPEHTYVLTFIPSESINPIKIKWVFSNVAKEIMSSSSRFYKVTHWMPLPLAPENQK